MVSDPFLSLSTLDRWRLPGGIETWHIVDRRGLSRTFLAVHMPRRHLFLRPARFGIGRQAKKCWKHRRSWRLASLLAGSHSPHVYGSSTEAARYLLRGNEARQPSVRRGNSSHRVDTAKQVEYYRG